MTSSSTWFFFGNLIVKASEINHFRLVLKRIQWLNQNFTFTDFLLNERSRTYKNCCGIKNIVFIDFEPFDINITENTQRRFDEKCNNFGPYFSEKKIPKIAQICPNRPQTGQKSLPNNETKMEKIDHCVLFYLDFETKSVQKRRL